MNRKLILALLVGVMAAGTAFGQPAQAPAGPQPNGQPLGEYYLADGQAAPQTYVSPVRAPLELFSTVLAEERGVNAHLYAHGEYLRWFLTAAPNPIPLLTTGDPNTDSRAGIVGARSTVPLFGAEKIGLDAFNGTRMIVGLWIGNARRFGIEGDGFWLEQRSSGFFFSGLTGHPFLGIPFQNAAGQEQRLLIANPGPPGNNLNQVQPLTTGIGDFGARYTTEYYGADVKGLFNVSRGFDFSIDLLGGFSFRQLNEGLDMTSTLQTTFDPLNPRFQFGGQADDHFSTENRFYGALIGARIGWRTERFSLLVTSRVLFGNNRQDAKVDGQSAFISTADNSAQVNRFGVFAQRSNIGSANNNVFTVIPEMNLQLGVFITQTVKLFAGLDASYWPGVIRPGNLIDRTINTNAGVNTQDYFTGLQTDVPLGSARPAPRFVKSDLWVSGFNVGAEIRY